MILAKGIDYLGKMHGFNIENKINQKLQIKLFMRSKIHSKRDRGLHRGSGH